MLLAAAPPLTIEAAVQRALEVAPELAARRRAEEAASARVGEATSSYLPRVSVEASYLAKYPRNELPIELPPIPDLPPVGEVDDIHHFQGGLKLGYRLFDLSRGPAIDAAEARVEAEKHTSGDVASSLAFRVRATYLAALLARDLATIATESLRVAREEERRAHLTAEVGTGTRVALAQARVRVAGLEAQEKRAKSELERYQAVLASLLDLPELPPLEGELEALAGVVSGLDPNQHPKMLELAASQRSAESAAKARGRSLIPTLSAQASIEVQYPRALRLEWGPVYQFGLLFSWPLFDGLARENAVEAGEALAAQLGELSRAKRREIERRLIELEARARTADADLGSARKTLEETEIYLEVARAAVEAGTGTELDVHSAELGIDRAKASVQQALFDKAMVRAEVLMVYGVSQEKDG